jgi:hypothetical protein
MNIKQGQIIAAAIERGKPNIGFQLIADIVRQKSEWTEAEIKSVALRFLSRQRAPPFTLSRPQVQQIGCISNQLTEIKKSIMKGEDIEKALNELDLILGSQQNAGSDGQDNEGMSSARNNRDTSA